MIHDWNYLLARLNLLTHAESLGRLVFAIGLLAIFSALGLLAADLVRSWERASRPHP